jgi:mRNA degradation ribonuclease J1/J2
MYEWIRPEIIVPVHGEMRHMAEHARFALENGVPQAASSRRMATSSASRPTDPRSSARSGSAG